MSKNARNQTTRQGPSPEALAAFYRLRSESLRDSHTRTEDVPMTTPHNPAKPETPVQADTRSWYQKLYSALSVK